MIQELHEEIDNWRTEYIHLGPKLGRKVEENEETIILQKMETRT